MAFRLNKAKIRQGVFILCHSETEAKNLLNELEKIGYSWNSKDGTPMSTTFWSNASNGEIAYYILDDQRKKLQYRVRDFDDVEDSTVSYADVMFKEQLALKSCSPPELQNSSKELAVKPPQHETSIPQSKSENKKEKKRMNIFGINMEFGMNTDENIASTFIGVAVKNGKSWRVYDKKKKTLTDIGDMDIGSLPLFIMPSTKLEAGDLIKSDGDYYYVVQVNDGNVKTLSAATGEMKEIVPVDNILGIRFYSKVVTLAEDLISNGEDDSNTDKLMMAMAMSSMTGDGQDQDSQMLLPLLLLKDKGDSDDKSANHLTKLMLVSSMCSNGRDQNALLPLLLLKGDLF